MPKHSEEDDLEFDWYAERQLQGAAEWFEESLESTMVDGVEDALKAVLADGCSTVKVLQHLQALSYMGSAKGAQAPARLFRAAMRNLEDALVALKQAVDLLRAPYFGPFAGELEQILSTERLLDEGRASLERLLGTFRKQQTQLQRRPDLLVGRELDELLLHVIVSTSVRKKQFPAKPLATLLNFAMTQPPDPRALRQRVSRIRKRKNRTALKPAKRAPGRRGRKPGTGWTQLRREGGLARLSGGQISPEEISQIGRIRKRP